MRETKTLALTEFKEADDDSGEFTGRASTFGTVDSYGDTIEPGAYKDTLPEFLTRGFIGWGHDWDEPIGYVKSAEERKDGLYITGRFHSDPEAQRRRTIARERVENQLFMGLSIGYEAIESEIRQVAEPVRGKWGEWTDKIRALTKIKLYEVSLVMVPAEANSGLTAIKGTGLTFAEHSEQVRVALLELVRRAESGLDTREKVGRALSAARRQQIEEFIGAMNGHLEGLAALLDESSGADEESEDGEPVVGLAAAVPDDLKAWVERYHKLTAIYG